MFDRREEEALQVSWQNVITSPLDAIILAPVMDDDDINRH